MTLSEIVRQKLMEMFARRLEYAPRNAEEVYACANVMVQDLMRLGLKDEDAERVGRTFDYLGPRIQKWPTTFMLKENMAKASGNKLLPEPPPVSHEKAKQYVEQIKKNIAQANGPLKESISRALENFGG